MSSPRTRPNPTSTTCSFDRARDIQSPEDDSAHAERRGFPAMSGRNERVSTYTSGSGETDGRNGEPKRNLWTSMLESVASGKKLPEKNLLVLGRP